MTPVQLVSADSARCGEVEITTQAVATYGRLLRAIGSRLHTHGTGDGGLICEDRAVRSRPTVWRISRHGSVVSDSPYSFASHAFVTADPPFAAEPPLAA